MDSAKRGTGHVRRGHKAVILKHDCAAPGVFRWPVRVYFEDTDAGGVVYHANYLRFMERARSEWLRTRGFEQDVLRSHFGILFVVTSAQIEYHRAARFNMQLEVSVEVNAAGRASLVFTQHICEAGAHDVSLCNAVIHVACVAADNFKPRPVPPDIMAELTR